MVTSDLELFRDAFRRLEKRLQEASRSGRYKPPTGLATARLHLHDSGPGDGVSAEVLDLSADGLRIAVDSGICATVGQSCRVLVGDGEGETYDLKGTVRWIEATSYISVIGLSLDSAERLQA